MRVWYLVAPVAATLLSIPMTAISPEASAHHAFAAEFDANTPLLLRGKVSRINCESLVACWTIRKAVRAALSPSALTLNQPVAGISCVRAFWLARSCCCISLLTAQKVLKILAGFYYKIKLFLLFIFILLFL